MASRSCAATHSGKRVALVSHQCEGKAGTRTRAGTDPGIEELHSLCLHISRKSSENSVSPPQVTFDFFFKT